MISPDRTDGLASLFNQVIKDLEIRAECVAIEEMKVQIESILANDNEAEIPAGLDHGARRILVSPWRPVIIEGLDHGESSIRFVKPDYENLPRDNRYDKYRIEGRIVGDGGIIGKGTIARIMGNDSLYGKNQQEDRIQIVDPRFKVVQGLVRDQHQLVIAPQTNT